MLARPYRRWLTAAALAIAPVLAPRVAWAQYLSANNSGHALDANSQVGSGGINGSVSNGGVTNNDIVFNNVTGLGGFHGRVDTFGSGAFQGGTLAGANTDAFVAQSSGAPTPYSPNFSGYTPRQFFGQSRGVNPPPGTILLGSSGAAIGTSLTPANPYNTFATADQLANISVGRTNIIGYGGDATNFLAVPGSPGSSLPNIQAALANQPLNSAGLSGGFLPLDAAALNDSLTNPTPGMPSPSTLDPNTVAAMQRALSATSPEALTPSASDLNNPNGTGNGNQNFNTVNPYNPNTGNPLVPQSQNTGARINGAINSTPLQMPAGSQLSSARLDDSVQGTPLNTYSESPNGVQLVSPQTYSSQYGQMAQQLQRFNVQQRPARTMTNRTKPGTGAPTTQPGPLPLPGTTPGTTPESTPGALPGAIPGAIPGAGPGVAPGAEKSGGVKISSIAATVTSPRAKSLHDLLAKGDDALKNDQFKDAISTYEGGTVVAPNNQMIRLGLGNADLAAGFYAAAETNIRRAFAADANLLLMARQDLTSMISAKRLDFVRSDLKDLADKNPKMSRPWLLLAYINYNTGHDQAAADDLKQAEKLSGSADPTIRLMQTYWQLPSASDQQSNPSLNK